MTPAPKHPRTKLSPAAWAALRHECYERDGHCCVWCGRYVPENEAHPHHIIYRSQFGSDVAENIATLCGKCHRLITDHEWEVLIGPGVGKAGKKQVETRLLYLVAENQKRFERI